MDVHPPQHPLHTWRDFFIRIATIVVGLLIAIGLEQTVELFHRHEQVHQAEHRLAVESESKGKTLEKDETAVAVIRHHVLADLGTLRSLRARLALNNPFQHTRLHWSYCPLPVWSRP